MIRTPGRSGRWLLLLLVLCGLQLALPAGAMELAGVALADAIGLDGEALLLNGAGIRGNFFISAYAIGLYLPHRADNVADVLAMPGPKRIHMHTLFDIPAEKFAHALEDGIRDNQSAEALAELKPRVDRLRDLILALKSSGKHRNIDLEWHPKSGTQVMFDGTPLGAPIPGEDLYRALLKIWLGEKVHDEKLRAALLGHAH